MDNRQNGFLYVGGCRQGDPISSYLFILCVEILGIMIRENKHIKGIFVNNVEHKLSQYADDTEFLLAGDRESFETCITVTDNSGRKSGLYMNAGTTSAVWLGSKRNSVVKYMQNLGMEWNPLKFKVLGIWFTFLSSYFFTVVQITYLDKCGGKKKKKLLIKVCRSKRFIENMAEKAHYTTWQSCSFKISCSVEAYTLTDSVTKPTR